MKDRILNSNNRATIVNCCVRILLIARVVDDRIIFGKYCNSQAGIYGNDDDNIC